jgi:hypothetical protein
MPSHPSAARALLAVDLSPQTDEALRWGEQLHASRNVVIDVFYVWSESPSPPVDEADRTRAAIARLARFDGAWDRLDRLNALERRGVVQVAGWLTRASDTGSSLLELGNREGYALVVVGLAKAPQPSHRFELHLASG